MELPWGQRVVLAVGSALAGRGSVLYRHVLGQEQSPPGYSQSYGIDAARDHHRSSALINPWHPAQIAKDAIRNGTCASRQVAGEDMFTPQLDPAAQTRIR